MSGHSHWSSIKYQKSATDAKRSKTFSKLARLIAVAAREKGGDSNFNPSLRIAIEKAHSFNMPKEKIENAIKKGTGELEGVSFEEFTFEAYGPGGIAIIVEGITDNRNRSIGEIKQILAKHGGKLAEEGSVKWMFERKGCIIVNTQEQDKEDLELKVIEAGAEDTCWEKDSLAVYTRIEDLEKVKKELESRDLKIESSSLEWVAKENIEIDEKNKQSCHELFELLDENDSVQEIYSNFSF